MNTYAIRSIVGIVLVTLSVLSLTMGNLDPGFDLVGPVISGLLLAASVYFLVGGSWHEIKSNRDRKGKNHSWRSTIIGSITLVVSIPVVILFALYILGYL